ncbi:hypothetical protein SKC42_27470, partial [Mycobacterium sp. 050134]
MITFSVLNGQKADDVTSRYKAVATGAVLTSGVVADEVDAAAAESTVSSFEVIADGVSCAVAMPGDASSARGARARLSNHIGQGETGRAGIVGEAPDDPTPQSTMPTMAKLTAVSGQTAKLSQGDASQH